MLHYNTGDLSVPEIHKLLLGGVGPRPIALVSTLSQDGVNNLSPFSFFNVFGANPPMLAFSPSRRGRDASLKDTYNNLVHTKECVVQSVTYSMVEQVSLASTEYPPGIDEFKKSGLTPIDSDIVKPKRVKESPFQMECKLVEMKSYGEGGASANMAICEIVKLHVAEYIFTNGIIDPKKIDLVGRMSGNYYCRANFDAIIKIEKPAGKNCIGYDGLPEFIRKSDFFTANEIARLANIEEIPDENNVLQFINSFSAKTLSEIEYSEEAFYNYQQKADAELMLKILLNLYEENPNKMNKFIDQVVRTALKNNKTEFAWNVLLYFSSIIKNQE